MAMLCPLCRSRYDFGAAYCPNDGMILVSRDEPLIGRLVDGRYRILERIGTGGVCVVYKVRHEPTGEHSAMKILPPARDADGMQRARFLREAKVASRLDHENIVRVFELGETDDGLVFMVMEHLPGPSLSSVVERGALPESRALTIALQIARALSRAHDFGVVHRDVKSDNVMFVSASPTSDRVKLLDFGLAATLGAHPLTNTGQLFGTPEYLSPEQTTGGKATGSSDLYALGVVLYEMLTGKPPFEGPEMQVMRAHLETKPAPPSSRPGAGPISAAVDALVLKLLSKAPQERPRDAHQLVDEISALLAVLGTRPLDDLQPAAPESAPPPGSTRDETKAGSGRARLRKLEGCLQRSKGQHPDWVEQALSALLPIVQEVAVLEESLLDGARRWRAEELRLRAERDRLGALLEVLSRDQAVVRSQQTPTSQESIERLTQLRARVEAISTEFEEEAAQSNREERWRSEQLVDSLAKIDNLATRLERYFQAYRPLRRR